MQGFEGRFLGAVPQVSKGSEFISMFISDALWEISVEMSIFWHRCPRSDSAGGI